MLLELIADRNGNALLQPYEESAIRPDQVRLKSVYSAIKHGTEFRTFQANTPDATSRWDPELRLHIRGEERKGMFPMALGNSCVGIVTDLGSNVTWSSSCKDYAHCFSRTGEACNFKYLTTSSNVRGPN